jgi:hypothetical protein
MRDNHSDRAAITSVTVSVVSTEALTEAEKENSD